MRIPITSSRKIYQCACSGVASILVSWLVSAPAFADTSTIHSVLPVAQVAQTTGSSQKLISEISGSAEVISLALPRKSQRNRQARGIASTFRELPASEQRLWIETDAVKNHRALRRLNRNQKTDAFVAGSSYGMASGQRSRAVYRRGNR